MTRPSFRVVAVTLCLAATLHSPAAAQSWARFAVADSVLEATLVSARGEYENLWNTLFIAGLRAGLARADSAARLGALERRLGRAEPRALTSHIAADALALSSGWTRADRQLRVDAAVAESLATGARAAHDWAAADSLYREALTRYRRLGEKRREAWVLGSLGVVALGAGHDDRALEVYGEALAARRALGDPRMLGNTLNDMGQTCFRQERHADAVRYLREAAEVRERSGQMLPLGATLGFLGSALVALGNRDSAERCFARSLELTSVAGDSARTLVTLINFGAMVMNYGDVERAIPLYERARVIARQNGDDEHLAVIEDNLGDLARQRGRFSEAVAHSQAAAALRAQDPPRLAVTLTGLGWTLVLMGDPDRARPPLERALAIADSLGDAALASRALSNLAFVAKLSGDASGARRLGRRAIERAEAAADSGAVRDAARTVGEIEIEFGSPAEAEAWIERGLAAVPDSPPEMRVGMLANRALTWQLQGRLAAAERSYRDVLVLAENLGLNDVVQTILTDLGDVAERRGDYTSAFARYGEALARIDTLRGLQGHGSEAVKTLGRRVFVHEAMIHLLGKLDAANLDSGYAARAFDWAERARARSLLDLAAAAAGHGGAVTMRTLEETRQALGSDHEAMLEYSVGDSSTSLWVIRRSGWRLMQLPSRAALRARLQQLRQSLGDLEADPARTYGQCRALYRLLVEPAEPMLGGVERLIISPDGPLALVPFEALLTRDPTGDSVPKRAFLIERYAVRYTPSASALTPGVGDRPPGGIVAVGNPRFAAAGDSSAAAHTLAPLPQTEFELECLTRLAHGRPLTVLSGASACAARVLALPELPGATLLHFATHGDVNEAEPDRSGLWLAPDSARAEPSRIEVADVLHLRLSADLVTLSACQTGLGRLERGEGVIGLQRAFLAAGARSVLVSLWSVNDRSTAELMDAFYRRAMDGREDRAGALAEAKRELLARPETRLPYYWAPFVLVGEPGGPAGRK